MEPTQFFAKINSISKKMTNMYIVRNRLQNDEDLKTILDLIKREFGNRFNLKDLLKNIKSKAGADLLHRTMMKWIEGLKKRKPATAFKSYRLIIPEASKIQLASEVDMKQVIDERNQLKTELELWEGRIKEVMRAGGDLESLAIQIAEWKKAKRELEELEITLRETKFLLAQTQIHFKLIDEGPIEFLGLWVGFCNDFEEIWGNEQQRVMIAEDRERRGDRISPSELRLAAFLQKGLKLGEYQK